MLTKTNEYVYYLFSGLSFTFLSGMFTLFYKNGKLGRNTSSLIHAGLSSFLSLGLIVSDKCTTYDVTNLELFIRCLSTGYFLYDTIITLYYQKGVMRAAYTYHHFASLILLDQNRKLFPIHEILFLAEASNIPSNFVYYHINNNSKKAEITKWKDIQKYAYLSIRIPILGAISLNYYFNFRNNPDILYKYYLMFPVYLMGVFWSYKLYKSK